MNHFKQIVKVIVNVFTWILFAILILVIYGKATVTFTNKNYPNYFGYTFFEVASGSMEPTLYINDVILVKITKENLNKDDIIAFEQGNAIITHRIIFIDNNTLTVKGDNNNTIDKPINRNSVIGKVVKIYSKLGIWKKVLTEPKIIFAIFITLLLFDFALSYSKEDEKDDKSKKENKNKKVIKEKSEEKIETHGEEVNDEKVEDNIEVHDETPSGNLIELKGLLNKEDIEIYDEEDFNNVEKLLDVTKKIDIEEINKIVDVEELKLSEEEVDDLKEKVSNLDDDIEMIDVSDELLKKHKFTEKEMDFIEYTMRLDLNEIMNKINRSIK